MFMLGLKTGFLYFMVTFPLSFQSLPSGGLCITLKVSLGFSSSPLDGKPKGRELNSKNFDYQEMTRLEQSADCTTKLVLHP